MLQGETRKLAAIMFTDIVGFSRQMGSDEARTLRLLEVHNQIVQHAVAEHHGTVIKTVGDAFLVDFPSVVHAVQCAQQIQAQFKAHNAKNPTNEQIHIRIGIHSGDIVQKDGDVFGDGVNIASRLQSLAEPDTICISDVVYRDVAKKLDLGTVVSLGRPQLKNIAERFQVYALMPETPKGLRQTIRIQRLKLSRRVGTVVFVLVFVSIAFVTGLIVVRYFSPSLLGTRNLELGTPAALPLPDKPSIVVLPFDNMSGDPQQDYFSNGITEVLTNDLSRISSLFVIARNTAFTYKGKAINVQDVGKELGVRYVLEGSVQKTADHVRIVAQLIDTTTGGHLWSERYDRPLQDIFALQDEIVQKIVTTLKLQLTLMEHGILVRKHTDNLEAYDYVLRGTESWLRFTKEANLQARQMFEKAIALDPQYAEAYARLGGTYWLEWFSLWSLDPQTQALEQAFAAAQQAVALQEALPGAHITLARVYLYKKQHERAITEAERALALDPNNANIHMLLGDILSWTEQPEKALRWYEQALRLNPRFPLHLLGLGWGYLRMGRYEEAIVPLKKVLTFNPNIEPAHTNLAVCYAELDRLEEARAEIAEIRRHNPNVDPDVILEVAKQRFPAKDPMVTERYLAALRKAGLK